jgi:hypothetical protein
MLLAVVSAGLAAELALAFIAAYQASDGGGAVRLRAGTLVDKPISRLRLRDEHGRRTSLGAFRGRYLVLAPSLTLCHEVCPCSASRGGDGPGLSEGRPLGVGLQHSRRSRLLLVGSAPAKVHRTAR